MKIFFFCIEIIAGSEDALEVADDDEVEEEEMAPVVDEPLKKKFTRLRKAT